ncbi:MAG: DUF2079 domain-containing protein [Candidatus Eremiobacteraeota bacterium]|nr:DUF2079 domain-containing protein [Candidatus Eremiobacteraeota bacterium]
MRSVYIAVGVFAVVYIGLDLNKLYALRYGADLGTYLQTLVNLRHGSSWNYGEWRPHLAVHDSWALAALVPVVALFPRAETLIVVQVLAVAVAAIPLALFARELGLEARSANVLGIAYLLTPSAQGLSYDNFSENVFAPLLAFGAALFVRRRALVPALIAGQLLLGLKEDQILFVLWFAVACALWWDRRIGIALAALAICNGVGFWLVERAAATAPNLPRYSLAVFDPGSKLSMLFLLLAPFAFAPVAVGWWLLLGVPLLAEIVLMRPWNYEASRVGSHYTAALVSASAIAAAFGVLRQPRFARYMIVAAVLVLLAFNDTVLRPGRWPYVVDWHAYARALALRDGDRAVLLKRRDEGVWAVAAANPRVRLDPNADPLFPRCPAYDTNAAAFFGSLAGRMPRRLCGGVPVSQ